MLGLLLTTQAALKEFPADGGSVINISSIAATAPFPNTSVYSGTKGAVDSITLTLAKELGPKKIRVNSVSPGPVKTEGAASFLGGDVEARAIAMTPLGRIGNPDDIGAAVTFFASEDSRWITGEIINVSGGVR